MKNKLKRDKFRTARGGKVCILHLYCRKCSELVIDYQKDGPGPIYRLYLDRIFEPAELVNLQYKNLKVIKPLCCSSCKELLGMPYVYQKEKRLAFRIFSGALIKK